ASFGVIVRLQSSSIEAHEQGWHITDLAHVGYEFPVCLSDMPRQQARAKAAEAAEYPLFRRIQLNIDWKPRVAQRGFLRQIGAAETLDGVPPPATGVADDLSDVERLDDHPGIMLRDLFRSLAI